MGLKVFKIGCLGVKSPIREEFWSVSLSREHYMCGTTKPIFAIVKSLRICEIKFGDETGVARYFSHRVFTFHIFLFCECD